MTFSDVVTAVNQAWEFAWPPVLRLVLVLFLFHWIAPTLSTWVRAAAISVFTPRRIRRIRVYFHLYGLSKLFPIMVAFALIFCLYLMNRIVYSIGGIFPPTIDYVPRSIINWDENQHILACLSCQKAKTVDLESLSTENQIRSLIYAINTVEEKVIAKANTNTYWRQQEETASREFIVAKFFIVLIMIILLAELLTVRNQPQELPQTGSFLRRQSYKRALFALVLTFVIAGYFTTSWLYAAHRNYSFSATEILRDIYDSDEYSKCEPCSLTELQRKTVKFNNQGRDWWRFRVEASEFVKWVVNILL